MRGRGQTALYAPGPRAAKAMPGLGLSGTARDSAGRAGEGALPDCVHSIRSAGLGRPVPGEMHCMQSAGLGRPCGGAAKLSALLRTMHTFVRVLAGVRDFW